MSEIIELLRQLVAIDSINPDLVPGSPGEEESDKPDVMCCPEVNDGDRE